ncbi:hypothetical protein [Pararhodospirillum photometricum]|uniref:hypothetical protein n=1 Tax=Pararhodospirillum photometricum TaxID=1084 RepID=UPI00030F727C|nr:hypothetical protein [Pararhodospirillum photometricum]
MANEGTGLGRGRIEGGYQGPVVLPGARLRPVRSSAGVASAREVRAPSLGATEEAAPRPRPSRDALGSGRFVVVDGRRYDLDAPRGTYYNFLI